MVFDLKKAQLRLILFSFPLLLLALAPLRASAVTAYPGTTASPSVDVQVDHSVQVREGGLVLINDTIRLSTKPGERVEPLQNVPMGFPFQYGSNLDYCFAYDASNPDVQFEVALDVGLGRVGFYGIDVVFPEPIDVSDGKSFSFTVVFVFSNLVSSITESSFKLDFPMYPSLTQEASLCSVTVTLPHDANYTESSLLERGLDFNVTTIDSRQVLNHTKSPLEVFTYEPAWLTFTTVDTFLIIDVDEIRREITLDEWGRLLLSDVYHLTNEAEREFSEIKIQLPRGAYGVSARDVLGDLSVVSEEGNATTYTNATVSFRAALKKGETGKFAVTYRLPWENYVNQGGWGDFNLTFTLFERFDWRIRKLAVTVNLPEGAEFQSSSINPHSVQKSVFQETVTFVLYDVTPFHDLNFSFSYGYLVFWASFRPTLWMGTLVVILGAIALVWRAPRPPVPIIPVPPEDLRSFIASYDEKRRILSELESIEQQVRKGKIPRRRYKVRKRTLEGRLSVLSRNLTGLRERIRRAGPRYANIMRQIEVAETMLEGAETDIRRIRARYRRREVSASAYRKLLEEYHRRRDRARTTIDGVLLRLREEIR
jgi:hypothetical protein